MFARLPADYDEGKDYAIRFRSGWTHEVMQKARDLVRHALVTVATGLVFGVAIGALTALAIWIF